MAQESGTMRRVKQIAADSLHMENGTVVQTIQVRHYRAGHTFTRGIREDGSPGEALGNDDLAETLVWVAEAVRRGGRAAKQIYQRTSTDERTIPRGRHAARNRESSGRAASEGARTPLQDLELGTG
jgi:hypothetical protein